ncbi:MAG: hypothetical protein JWR71_1435 [Pseudarthrobacter sp.]|nr:hypothetical protein [Pseudarthrobacter sp.]
MKNGMTLPVWPATLAPWLVPLMARQACSGTVT